VVIGGSAGSFPVVSKILQSLPKSFPLPIVLCLHRLKHIRHGFVEALSIKSTLPVSEPNDKEIVRPGRAYLAPANYHMYLELGNTFALSTDEMVNFSRPAIDLTFDSVSYIHRDKMIGIMLSGANSDGAQGIYLAKKRGATTIVQDPDEATMRTMPDAALRKHKPDHILNSDGIINFLKQL
jgi:two-component system chemotaxis response regulator CheB